MARADELSRQLLMEPTPKGLLKKPAALFTGCSLESFRLNGGFSIWGNNDLNFQAATSVNLKGQPGSIHRTAKSYDRWPFFRASILVFSTAYA